VLVELDVDARLGRINSRPVGPRSVVRGRSGHCSISKELKKGVVLE